MKFRTLALPALFFLMPTLAYALPSANLAASIIKSNNIILMEGDLVGPVKTFRQYVIGPESNMFVRDVSVDFDPRGQILGARQSYGPNPVWESQLMPDGIAPGWISRSAIAVKISLQQRITQLISVYKTDKRGRITKVSEVEAQPGAIGVTNRYYFYTADGVVRFYLAAGNDPGFGIYLYAKDGRLTKVIKHNNLSNSTFTPEGKDLSTMTKTPYITYTSECQQWDRTGNCILVEKQERRFFRHQGKEETQVVTLWQRQNINYYPPVDAGKKNPAPPANKK